MYVSYFTPHNDLQIPFVIEEIRRLSTLPSKHNRTQQTSCRNQQPIKCKKKIEETVAVWPTTTRRWRKFKPPPFLYRAFQSIICGWLLCSSHHHSSTWPVRVSSVDDFSAQATTIPLQDLSESHQWMTSLLKPPPFLYRACQSLISGWLLYSNHHHSSTWPVRVSSVDDFSTQTTTIPLHGL
jgi:hypothetical protein